jgi:hypothetical protein
MKIIMHFLPLGFLILAACTGSTSPESSKGTAPPEPTPAPWEQTAGDNSRVRGEVFLESTDIVILESDTPKFVLRLAGALPTPCHELRVAVSKPDDENDIQVEVYSVTDPDEICIQVLEPFDTTIPLGVLAAGEYQVVVNGNEIGVINP